MDNKHSILFSEMIPEKDWEQEFNNWYDTEHIPVRMDVKGFQLARRYREVDSSKYLAVYQMDNLEVLQGDAYGVVKNNPSDQTRWMLDSVDGFTRYIGELISEQINENVKGNPYDAPILYSVMFQVPASEEKEFNDWYTEDHVPTLLNNDDWLACRRYKIDDGEPEQWTHLALHYLNSTDALDSEERKIARNSPWRDKLATKDWFKGKYMIFEHIKSFQSTWK